MKVVQFSLGITSAESARLVAESGEPFVLLTANTRIEDDDCWRFGRDVWGYLGQPTWHVITDGRTPMQVGRDRRCVPSDRMTVCSQHLKIEPLRRFINRNYDPTKDQVVLGFDWTEPHRHPQPGGPWEPWTTECPLGAPPADASLNDLLDPKPGLLKAWRARGIEPPSLYDEGFQHANCGGGCVRAGQASWELLLRVHPDRYRSWEDDEEGIRAMLGKDVAMMTETVRGESRPLTLRRFRQRIEAQPSLFDGSDWGACNCLGDAS